MTTIIIISSSNSINVTSVRFIGIYFPKFSLMHKIKNIISIEKYLLIMSLILISIIITITQLYKYVLLYLSLFYNNNNSYNY